MHTHIYIHIPLYSYLLDHLPVIIASTLPCFSLLPYFTAEKSETQGTELPCLM